MWALILLHKKMKYTIYSSFFREYRISSHYFLSFILWNYCPQRYCLWSLDDMSNLLAGSAFFIRLPIYSQSVVPLCLWYGPWKSQRSRSRMHSIHIKYLYQKIEIFYMGKRQPLSWTTHRKTSKRYVSFWCIAKNINK